MEINEIINLEKQTPLRYDAWKRELKANKKFEWSCKAGVSSIAIDFQGNAFVCGLYRKNPISILSTEIDAVIEHLRRIHEEHVRIIENNKCSACDKRNICKWCPAYSLKYNANDNEEVKFFCELARGRVEAFGESI